AQKHMAQMQHNMMVAGTKRSVLSIITGGGKWVEMAIAADPVYQTALIARLRNPDQLRQARSRWRQDQP
ncbi:MAG: hypothetical protein NTV56_20475, partial [Alphaproteobacteria bacterium]|nr:hypothetical protein [Alphaproteobacteria bacterium]